MTIKRLFFSLLLAVVAGFSCEKDQPATDPYADLDAQLADITGIYHGTIRNWVVNGQDVPGDTIWDIYPSYFVLRTGRRENDSWVFLVNSDSLSADGSSHYDLSGGAEGDPVYFLRTITVDPLYGFSDGQSGDWTVWRSTRKAQGRFSHNTGPGRYGYYFEGYK